MSAILAGPPDDRAAEIVALFAVLIHAWQSNHFQDAARTQSELARLGIKVTMPRRRTGRKAVSDAP